MAAKPVSVKGSVTVTVTKPVSVTSDGYGKRRIP